MSRLPKVNDAAPFQRVPAASRITGLSQSYLRAGCRAGTIPHVKCGRDNLINIPALLKQLGVVDGHEAQADARMEAQI